MRFLSTVVFASGLLSASAHPLSFLTAALMGGDAGATSKPTVEEAAVQVRQLVRSEKYADLNTVYQDGELAGSAVGLLEYYADCDTDGSLTLLMVEVGPTYNNWKAGSPVSFSIRYSPKFHPSLSPASEPRASLAGSLSFIPEDDTEAIEKAKSCFLKNHPDATAWLPGNKIHPTAFMKFDVESVYWLGGFGNVAYIGNIPIELYKNATVPPPKFHLPHFPPKHGEDDDGQDETAKQNSFTLIRPSRQQARVIYESSAQMVADTEDDEFKRLRKFRLRGGSRRGMRKMGKPCRGKHAKGMKHKKEHAEESDSDDE